MAEKLMGRMQLDGGAKLPALDQTLVAWVVRGQRIIVHFVGPVSGAMVFEREGWEDGIFAKALVEVTPTLDEHAARIIEAIEEWWMQTEAAA